MSSCIAEFVRHGSLDIYRRQYLLMFVLRSGSVGSLSHLLMGLHPIVLPFFFDIIYCIPTSALTDYLIRKFWRRGRVIWALLILNMRIAQMCG
jgi:hypothetical protein